MIPQDDNNSLPTYSLDQLKTHDSPSSSWLAIDGYVYDVTSFLEEHPGGRDIMIEYLGKDVTKEFTSDEVHSHSMTAFQMLERYCIGVLSDGEVKKKRVENSEYEGIVDITKPILPQIPLLGEKYNPWLHTHFGLQKIIIFDNFLELFTRWPWYYIFVLWSPFVYYMMKTALENVSIIHAIIFFVFGLLSWSIVEYVLHRFVFHVYTNSTGWNIFHFFAHGIHHLTPNDSTRLTFPPSFSLVILLFFLRISYMIPPSSGIHASFGGLTTGFVLYDSIHYYFHHGDAPWLPTFLKKMKSAHLDHHYKNDKANFGVTSPLFDWVFGTLAKN